MGESLGFISPVDIMIFLGLIALSVLAGYALYRNRLRAWVVKGNFPRDLRWAAFWFGLFFMMLFTIVPFQYWPLLEIIRQNEQVIYVLYGITAVLLMVFIWRLSRCRTAE